MDQGLAAPADPLAEWLEGPLGESLQALEAHRLREILPALPGTFAVQLGGFGRRDLLESSPTAVHVLIDPRAPSLGGQYVQALPEALPLDGKSVQVVLLPHTLDMSGDPHQLLREAHRVLVPEGYVVVVGFNPFSFWGLRRLVRGSRTRLPWCADWIGVRRLKDWLALLDFELTHGSMLYYRPPLKRRRLMDHLFFLERIGDRWWPMAAAVYVVVAKKRTLGLTPITPALRRSRVRALSQTAGARYG